MAGRPIRYPMLRRSRAILTTKSMWAPRLVFWIGALAIGCVSVLFARLADAAHDLFRHLTEAGTLWSSLAVTPAVFVLSAWLAARYFPGSQGSGIPQAIAARHLRDDADRGLLLSLRIAAGKILLTLIGLAAGASIGREGPTVQVGAAMMLLAARIGGMRHARGLILAGSAAGIAAAFNTPLAGIVFAIEEMGRTYQSRTNGLVLSAVILAGIAALALVGNYNYFGEIAPQHVGAREWLLVVGCGTLGGLAGSLFSMAALKAIRRIRRSTRFAPLRRSLLVALACGSAVAVIGVATGGQTFGTGYEQASAAVSGTPSPWYYFAAKLAASLLSMISGIPGGIFAPSLSVGAGLGSDISLVIGTSVSLGAVLGMAGYFAGVVQAPMTAFVIVLEMTGSHGIVVPLMCAAMLGYGTSRLVSREPLYHALSRLFVADVIRQRRAQQA